MSDFTVIRAVSKTLESLLTRTITNSPDPQLAGVKIDLRSPKEMRQAQATGVSLWLYRVNRDPDLLNRPPDRVGPGRLSRPAIPVRLFYLVTPLVTAPEDRQVLLGRVLQVFNDHAVVRGGDLQDTLQGTPDQYRLTLESLTLEELTRVWYSLHEPYDLSVTYEVQVVEIGSDEESVAVPPVLVKTADFVQITGR